MILVGAEASKTAAPLIPDIARDSMRRSAGDVPEVPNSLSRGRYLGKFIRHRQQRLKRFVLLLPRRWLLEELHLEPLEDTRWLVS